MNRIIITSAIVLALISCQTGDGTVSILDKGIEPEYNIHLKEIKDSLHLKLSDIATDFDFVVMETRPECIFDKGDIYLTESYILVNKAKHGILQFTKDGKFIRTLVNTGKGPEEYEMAYWTVDENQQILYLSDYLKENYFLRYDLNRGLFAGSVKKAIPGKTKNIVFSEGQLLVVPSGGGDDKKKGVYFYRQDLNGNLISSVQAPSGYYMSWGGNSLINDTGDLRFHVSDDDTVYSILPDNLINYITFDFGDKNPPDRNYVGHKMMTINFESGPYVFFDNFHITGIEKEGNVVYTSGKEICYVMDKQKGAAFFSGQMYFDPTMAKIESDDFQFNIGISNSKLCYKYQAVDLIEHGQKALTDEDFNEPYRSMLSDVLEGLDENDNPVLLVGKLK